MLLKALVEIAIFIDLDLKSHLIKQAYLESPGKAWAQVISLRFWRRHQIYLPSYDSFKERDLKTLVIVPQVVWETWITSSLTNIMFPKRDREGERERR